MPAEFDFLKETCQITNAEWAALLDRETGCWQVRAAHQLGRPLRESLLEHLSRPAVDAWLCGSVNAGRPRSRPAPEISGLEKVSLFVYPIARTFSVLLVGAKRMDPRMQRVWKLAASLRARTETDEGVSLLQSELLLPNLQSEAPYDQTRVLGRVLHMFTTRVKAQGGWLAIRRADMLDVLAQWNSPQVAGVSMSVEDDPLWRRVNKTLKPLLVDASQPDWERVPREAAHMIARVVYRMLKYKVEYETINIEEYEAKYKEQQIKYMRKKAAKLGFQLVPA